MMPRPIFCLLFLCFFSYFPVSGQSTLPNFHVFLPDGSELDKGLYVVHGRLDRLGHMVYRPEIKGMDMCGVDVYDILLLQKHIQGVMPILSPYGIIAADVNTSRSITPVDIIELRKLLLGIYPDGLPANTSWRFVDRDFAFPDPNNPFVSVFPETVTVTLNPALNPNAHAKFEAVKVGDMDCTAVVCKNLEKEPVTQLNSMLTSDLEIIDLIYEGTGEIEALQMGLSFDANKYDFYQVDQGDLYGVDLGSFNMDEVRDGKIRFVWFDPGSSVDNNTLKKGGSIFRLILKKKEGTGNNRAAQVALWGEEGRFDAMAWDKSGKVVALEKNAVNSRSEQVGSRANKEHILTDLRVHPNPTTGVTQIDFILKKAGTVKCFLFSAFGKTESFLKLDMERGAQQVTIEKMGDLPAGIYTYVLSTPDGMQKGMIVKQ